MRWCLDGADPDGSKFLDGWVRAAQIGIAGATQKRPIHVRWAPAIVLGKEPIKNLAETRWLRAPVGVFGGQSEVIHKRVHLGLSCSSLEAVGTIPTDVLGGCRLDDLN